jgi:hypothetical protein
MSNSEATVHLTKIAAAKRQLDTAIRLYFAHDDELSIHTLVAAAFGILRDLIKKRGSDFEAEVFKAGFYAWAKQYRAGTLSEDVSKALKESGLLPLLETIAADEDPSHIRIIRDKTKSRGWPSGPANFLKHADWHPNALLAASDINNEHFLIGACTAYLELMPTPSPEIMAFKVLWAVEHDAALDADAELACELADRLASLKKDERYRVCAEWVRQMKN